MQTIKKVILVVICLVVLLTSLVLPSVAVDIKFQVEDLFPIELPDTPMQDLIDVWDPYAPMLMLTQTQNWLGDASKLDGFQLSKAVLNSPHFIYADDLPFGSDTLVFGFRNNINTAIYFIYLNAKAHNIVLQTWNENNGRCAINVMSDSPIYRIGYGMAQGNLISFNGHTGLTDAGTRVNDTNVWSFPYTFIANDFYCIATSNLYDPEGDSTLIIGDSVNYYESTEGIDFDVDIYPSINDKNNLLQQEQNDLIEEGNETSKGIWNSIKELPSKIADSISGLFDKLINYLLYFQETKPEHVNPFADILTDVKSFFNDQMSDVGDFKNSLSSTLNNVVTYIETGSGVVNTFLTAVPMLSAFITFFVVFCIVRKVIGR